MFLGPGRSGGSPGGTARASPIGPAEQRRGTGAASALSTDQLHGDGDVSWPLQWLCFGIAGAGNDEHGGLKWGIGPRVGWEAS